MRVYSYRCHDFSLLTPGFKKWLVAPLLPYIPWAVPANIITIVSNLFVYAGLFVALHLGLYSAATIHMLPKFTADAVIERPVLPMLRLIANLTSNAIKHTAAGEVRVAAGPAEGAAAFVEVADTGPGLSAEDLARLRQPGIKGEASEGSGWGLAIVDDLAAKLGAQVEFHTAPGAGMRVRILI